MSQLVQEALDGALGAGASYADARLHRRVDEQYAARRQQVSEAARTESVGLAVRVLHHGAWGFAATAEFAPAAVRRAAALAVANAAAAAATQRQKVRWPTSRSITGGTKRPVGPSRDGLAGGQAEPPGRGHAPTRG